MKNKQIFAANSYKKLKQILNKGEARLGYFICKFSMVMHIVVGPQRFAVCHFFSVLDFLLKLNF